MTTLPTPSNFFIIHTVHRINGRQGRPRRGQQQLSSLGGERSEARRPYADAPYPSHGGQTRAWARTPCASSRTSARRRRSRRTCPLLCGRVDVSSARSVEVSSPRHAPLFLQRLQLGGLRPAEEAVLQVEADGQLVRSRRLVGGPFDASMFGLEGRREGERDRRSPLLQTGELRLRRKATRAKTPPRQESLAITKSKSEHTMIRKSSFLLCHAWLVVYYRLLESRPRKVERE